MVELSIVVLGIVGIGILIVGYFLGRVVRAKDLKGHRADAIKRSRAVLSGQFSEQLAPVLPGFLYNPNECRFVGKPIDFVVFRGLDEKKVDEVVFVEVKSGKSGLSSVERSLKEAVEGGRVRWELYRTNLDSE